MKLGFTTTRGFTAESTLALFSALGYLLKLARNVGLRVGRTILAFFLIEKAIGQTVKEFPNTRLRGVPKSRFEDIIFPFGPNTNVLPLIPEVSVKLGPLMLQMIIHRLQ